MPRFVISSCCACLTVCSILAAPFRAAPAGEPASGRAGALLEALSARFPAVA